MRTAAPILSVAMALAACQPVSEPQAGGEHINLAVDANGKVTGTRNGKPMTPAELEAYTAQAEAKKPLDLTEVIRIALYRDGRIEVDGAATEAEQVGDKLKSAAASKKTVLYYREDAEYGLSPQQKGAMPAILGAVAEHQLPIRLSINPDFSDAVNDKGISRTP
jgi:hypothetical protein